MPYRIAGFVLLFNNIRKCWSWSSINCFVDSVASNLVRITAPLTRPSGLPTPSASQLQASIPPPVRIATPQTQSVVQSQPSTLTAYDMSGIEILAAVAAAAPKLSTGTTFPIMLHVVILNGNIKGKPKKVKWSKNFKKKEKVQHLPDSHL